MGWMNARLSLALGGGNFGARKSVGESGVYIQLFLQSNDHNCQQSTINNQVGRLQYLPYIVLHLDEVGNLRTVNKAPAYEEAKAESGNTKVHLLEKGNPGKWGMEKNKIYVLNYRNFV